MVIVMENGECCDTAMSAASQCAGERNHFPAIVCRARRPPPAPPLSCAPLVRGAPRPAANGEAAVAGAAPPSRDTSQHPARKFSHCSPALVLTQQVAGTIATIASPRTLPQ